MDGRNRDEWTVERWRLEPHWRTLGPVEEPELVEQAPPLWKDLTAASIVALFFWVAAAMLFS